MSTKVARQVEFKLDAPQALAVCLAGDFNNWDPTRAPLKRDSHGIWKTTVPLTRGRHQYRFVVDGQWQSDPKAKESVANQFGSENSITVV